MWEIYICNLSAVNVAREVTGNGNAYTEMYRSLENNNNEQGSALAPKVSKEWMKGCVSEKANVPLSGKTVWMGACSVATEHMPCPQVMFTQFLPSIFSVFFCKTNIYSTIIKYTQYFI